MMAKVILLCINITYKQMFTFEEEEEREKTKRRGRKRNQKGQNL